MEISFDEHMAQLKKLKSFHNGSYGASINFALDTMRKYQKIQEIIDNWTKPEEIEWAIREVLEDGDGRQQTNG